MNTYLDLPTMQNFCLWASFMNEPGAPSSLLVPRTAPKHRMDVALRAQTSRSSDDIDATDRTTLFNGHFCLVGDWLPSSCQ